MPPKSAAPRAQVTNGWKGFRPGQGRWNSNDAKYKKYADAYEIHATIETVDRLSQVQSFHISIYHYPYWTPAKQDERGKSRLGCWAWTWDSGTAAYTVAPSFGRAVTIPKRAFDAVVQIASSMKGVCFTTGNGPIASPQAGVGGVTVTVAAAAASSSSSSEASEPPESASTLESPQATRRKASDRGWKTVPGRPDRNAMQARRQQRDSKAAAFVTAVPPDSQLGKWMNQARADGTRDERGRGSWQEQSTENAAREALKQHQDFDAAERLIGRAIVLRQRPPEGTDEDQDRGKRIGALASLRSDLQKAKAVYMQALRGG